MNSRIEYLILIYIGWFDIVKIRIPPDEDLKQRKILQFKGSVTPPTRCKVKLQTEILQLTNFLNCFFIYSTIREKKKSILFRPWDD